MKKKNAVKGFLFSILSIASVPVFAQTMRQLNDLALVEQLPTEVRQVVYERVGQYLVSHPYTLREDLLVAIDEKGNVYVIDKNEAQVAGAGQPSTLGR